MDPVSSCHLKQHTQQVDLLLNLSRADLLLLLGWSDVSRTKVFLRDGSRVLQEKDGGREKENRRRRSKLTTIKQSLSCERPPEATEFITATA